jgi:hypothetical protein
MSAAVAPADVESVLPDWVPQLLAEGGERNPWITVPDALPYLPMDRHKAYRQCQAYLSRLERERKRRRSYLLPADALLAKPGELPCEREGRSIIISKRYLVIRLLGYLPIIEGMQP